MALKSEKWFFKKALAEERSRTRLGYLSAHAIDLGFGSENTSGHIRQAVGAAQEFFRGAPAIVGAIRAADPGEPLDLAATGVLARWNAFIAPKAGVFGQARFGYDWDILKGYLTPRLGGRRTGGGGGDDELQIVLRLIAEFV